MTKFQNNKRVTERERERERESEQAAHTVRECLGTVLTKTFCSDEAAALLDLLDMIL